LADEAETEISILCKHLDGRCCSQDWSACTQPSTDKWSNSISWP
jgi:hypothetical protein